MNFINVKTFADNYRLTAYVRTLTNVMNNVKVRNLVLVRPLMEI